MTKSFTIEEVRKAFTSGLSNDIQYRAELVIDSVCRWCLEKDINELDLAIEDTKRLIRCLESGEIDVSNIHENNELVHHPDHYQSNDGIEVIDVIEYFTKQLTGVEAFDAGNMIKYACRWHKKNGGQDLNKLLWYTEHLKKQVINYAIQEAECYKKLVILMGAINQPSHHIPNNQSEFNMVTPPPPCHNYFPYV